MTSRGTYDRPSVSVNDDGVILIRASQVDSCSRQLWYSGMAYPKSDKVSPEAKARMAMGNILEPLVVDMLNQIRSWSG